MYHFKLQAHGNDDCCDMKAIPLFIYYRFVGFQKSDVRILAGRVYRPKRTLEKVSKSVQGLQANDGTKVLTSSIDHLSSAMKSVKCCHGQRAAAQRNKMSRWLYLLMTMTTTATTPPQETICSEVSDPTNILALKTSTHKAQSTQQSSRWTKPNLRRFKLYQLILFYILS